MLCNILKCNSLALLDMQYLWGRSQALPQYVLYLGPPVKLASRHSSIHSLKTLANMFIILSIC